MGNVVESIAVAFKELLSWNSIKYALIVGIASFTLWIVIGALFWDSLVSVSSYIIDLVPFSMVRANGSWMLSAFLWLQLTLISYAIFYAFFGSFLMRKLHINRYALFSLTIIALSGIMWGIVWYFKGGVIHDELNRLLTLLPFETVEKANAFLILFFMLYNGMVVFTLFTTSFFSKGIVRAIESNYFKDAEVVRDNLFNSIGHTVKDTVIFALLSIVLFPLLFIPLVNIVVQFILWLFLTKDTLAYDGAALSYKDVSQAPIKEHKAAIWSIASVAVAFNFIPIVNFFGPLFGELAMFHYFKKLSQK